MNPTLLLLIPMLPLIAAVAGGRVRAGHRARRARTR